MKDEENISKIQDIGNNNYLLNAYLHLIKIEFCSFFYFINRDNNEYYARMDNIYK